jgi:hypothetical protein
MTKVNGKVKIDPWIISPQEDAALRATDATFQWVCNLSGEQLRQYAGQWVAARDCRVIASGKTMDEMLTQFGRRGLADGGTASSPTARLDNLTV